MGSMRKTGLIISVLFLATWATAAGITTPLMGLKLPVPGPGGTLGPQWASMLNTAIQSIDTHNHTTGKGAKVTTAGLLIDGDLNFNEKNATSVKSTRYSSQLSTLVGATDKNAVYSVNGNLYFNNGSGTAIQLTSGSGLNAASIGGIGGDYATSGAALSYSDTIKTFGFTQSSGVPAKISTGDISLFEPLAGTQAVTIKSPSGLSAAYNLTVPSSLPASTLPVKLSATGVLSSSLISTADIADANVTTVKIADANVTTAKIADNAVTTAKIPEGGITTARIADGAVTLSKTATPGFGSTVGVGGYAITSEIDTATSSNAPVALPGSTLVITTTGRPVIIEIVARHYAQYGISLGGFGLYSNSTNGGTMTAYRDGVRRCEFTAASSLSNGIAKCIDTSPPAGQHTYTFTYNVSINNNIWFSGSLLAYELR